MITRLSIKGLAIIDSLSIEFSPGFNVITGETGAGKSILIRALNFLIGAKASSESVRMGYETATVVGEFYIPKAHPGHLVLERLEIPAEEEGQDISVVIRRTLTSKGRTQCWINDTVVTTTALREIGITLVDVFGQHENQRLLNPAQHLNYIDSFVPDKNLKLKLPILSKECTSHIHSIENRLSSFLKNAKDKDYFQFRLGELKTFDPSQENYENVLKLSQSGSQIAKVKELLSKALQYIEEGEETISKRVWEVAKILGHHTLEELKLTELKALADEVAAKLDNLSYELGRKASSYDIDENALDFAEKRLYGYQEFFRKYGVKDGGELVKEVEKLSLAAGSIEAVGEKIEEDLMALEKKAIEIRELALCLSKARFKAVSSIKKSVEGELHQLSMVGAIFGVAWKDSVRNLPEIDLSQFSIKIQKAWALSSEILSRITSEGSEIGEFLLASNPGETTLPLVRIASGGELSRIMLALKKALVADAETCVLVFDEIDSGISGRVADVVGKKMHELSSDFQVICISHLPQVAVYADTHFLVSKVGIGNKDQKRTESSIIKLTRDESAKEIARLLSGKEVSTSSLANAKYLIKKARGKGESPSSPIS